MTWPLRVRVRTRVRIKVRVEVIYGARLKFGVKLIFMRLEVSLYFTPCQLNQLGAQVDVIIVGVGVGTRVRVKVRVDVLYKVSQYWCDWGNHFISLHVN